MECDEILFSRWSGNEITETHPLPGGYIRKAIKVQDKTFYVLNTGELYIEVTNHNLVKVTTIGYYIRDAEFFNGYLFYITISGLLYKSKINFENLSLELVEVVECDVCYHGHAKQSSHKIAFRKLAAGKEHMLILSANYELWVLGKDVPCGIYKNPSFENWDTPQPIEFFKGRKVKDISAGDNFSVALVQSIFDEDTADITSTDCISCEQASSPKESDVCPLGLQVDDSQNSSPRKDDDIDPEDVQMRESKSHTRKTSRFGFIGESIEGELESSSLLLAEEHLSSSPLHMTTSFINPVLEQTYSIHSNIKGNVNKVANVVMDGVKHVGDKLWYYSPKSVDSCEFPELSDNVDHTKTKFYISLTEGTPEGFSSFEEPNISPRSPSDKLKELATSGHRKSASLTGIKFLNDDEQRKLMYVETMYNTGKDIIEVEVWTWGNNDNGQLGKGDSLARTQPTNLRPLNNAVIQQIYCGPSQCLAVSFTGEVWVWGAGDSINITKINRNLPYKVPLPKETSVATAACGRNFSMLVTKSGKVYKLNHQRFVSIFC